MSFENLIREAVADQADRAVDPGLVLRELQREKRRSRPIMVFAVATAVIALVSVIVIPQLVRRQQEVAGAPATPAALTVLVMGKDDTGNTDAIMLTRLDRSTSSAISLPRDTWLDIPGFGVGKLNSAYPRGRQAAVDRGLSQVDAERQGAATTVAAVSALIGAKIDHYLVIDMAAVGKVVSAVGGVEVTLCAAIQDQLAGARFAAGRQTLSGSDALAFIRQRHGLPNGDLDRVQRQQVFLGALLDRMITKDTAAAAVDAVRGSIVTDLDLVDLVARVGELDRGPSMGVIPVKEKVIDGRAGLEVSPDEVRAFVNAQPGPDPVRPCVN
jgi:LCP family protein required for cell wall assembly